jgi:hypothetical protein
MALLGAVADAVATKRYPLPPVNNKRNEPGGWVRLLGRVLSNHLIAWSKPETLNREHNDYELEAFALAINAGSLWVEVASRYNMLQASIDAFQVQYVSFSKALVENFFQKEADSQYVETCSKKYILQEDFLRLSSH